jgi:hypothetical protein
MPDVEGYSADDLRDAHTGFAGTDSGCISREPVTCDACARVQIKKGKDFRLPSETLEHGTRSHRDHKETKNNNKNILGIIINNQNQRLTCTL